MKKLSTISTPVILFTVLATPFFAFAQSGINMQAIMPYSKGIIDLINGVFVPVLFALALLTFFWGVYKYFFLGADSDTERAKGRDFILWGIIGFVVILSVWGLVAIMRDTFGLGASGYAPNYPTL